MAIGGKAVLVLLLCIMVTHAVEGVVTCQTVISYLTPCIGYLTQGGPVSSECCSGLNSLVTAAATTTDRQTICKCMKQAGSMISSVSLDAARSLPGKCGINIPYNISPTSDCSKVQ